MQTSMAFSWLISKDFIGQTYGRNLNLSNLPEAEANHYRELAYAVLEMISTDSLTIMRGRHLSSPILGLTAYFDIAFIDRGINTTPLANMVFYMNGTDVSWPQEANMYTESIFNLINIASQTVYLDLGSAGPESIYLNSSAVNKTIGENIAPNGIAPAEWAQNSESFYYGRIPGRYQTWAQAIRAGHGVKLGNATGIPRDSGMDITYLCPTYRLKPARSLLTSIFVGTATMVLSVWGLWMFVTGLVARKIKEPCELFKFSEGYPTKQR